MSEIRDCVEHGAGTCLNADLIDDLRAENERLREALRKVFDYDPYVVSVGTAYKEMKTIAQEALK